MIHDALGELTWVVVFAVDLALVKTVARERELPRADLALEAAFVVGLLSVGRPCFLALIGVDCLVAAIALAQIHFRYVLFSKMCARSTSRVNFVCFTHNRNPTRKRKLDGQAS